MTDSNLVDPLGRAIVLHDHTWFGHILKRHPELRRFRRQIEDAIAQPREIRISPGDADVRFYYAPSPRPGLILIVVVDVVHGFVKTAHFVKAAKGAIEW